MMQVHTNQFNTPPPPIVGQATTTAVNAANSQSSHPFQSLVFKPFKPPDGEFDGKRLRKSVMRKTVDYNSSVVQMLENRIWQRDERDRPALPPDICYASHILPPPAYLRNPINSVVTKFVRTSSNKAKCPIFCLAWTPEGRRLVTGASSGEFTLWNGLTFNFETILQAHDSSVRAMVWSHNDQWMVTGDTSGYVKYWQSNMNNVQMFQAHVDPVRGITFSPNDQKFASGSDDGTVKLWDFFRCQEEKVLRGHGADVKCVSWHPSKSLLASGSKDNQQPIKLWDPRTGTSLAKLHAHKSTVMDLKWNPNGNWLCSASRDHLLKLFDVRNFSTELQVFRGHKKEAACIAWHPQHESLFASGGSDGSILFWNVGNEKEVGAIESAHDGIIWDLAWHPLGHLLCSGSNDHTSKFWTRNRPGDKMRDKYNLNTLPPGAVGDDCIDIDSVIYLEDFPQTATVAPTLGAIPGMGPDDRVEAESEPKGPETIPGLDFEGLALERFMRKTPYAKPIPKNFQVAWNAAGTLNENMEENPLTSWVVVESEALFSKPANLEGEPIITEEGEELPPGSIPLDDIKANAITYYGFYIPLEFVSGLEIQDAFNFLEEEEAILEITNDPDFARKLIKEKKGLYNPGLDQEIKTEEDTKPFVDNQENWKPRPNHSFNERNRNYENERQQNFSRERQNYNNDRNYNHRKEFSPRKFYDEKPPNNINPWDMDHPVFKQPQPQNMDGFPFNGPNQNMGPMNQQNMGPGNPQNMGGMPPNMGNPNFQNPNFMGPVDMPFPGGGGGGGPMFPPMQEGGPNDFMNNGPPHNGMPQDWQMFGPYNDEPPGRPMGKGFRRDRDGWRGKAGRGRDSRDNPDFRGKNKGTKNDETKKESWREAQMPGQWETVKQEDDRDAGVPWQRNNWNDNMGRGRRPPPRGGRRGKPRDW